MVHPVLECPPQPVVMPAITEPGADEACGRIVGELLQRLQASSYCFLKAVSGEFADGTMTLRGRVPSYYLKQIAQTLAGNIAGVDRIVNLIDVANPR